MLPRVRINYANGTLGQVAAMADGCLGMMALGAKEVTGDDKFKLGKAYTLRKLADLEALGVTSENNPNLYRNVKEFYAEAGDGTELWLTGYAESETFANAFDKDNAAGAVALLKASNGKIRGLVAFKTPAEAYELTTTEGLDADVFAALPKAQQLGDWATDTLRAPIFSLVEGYGYAGDPAALKDLTETEYNRAGVVLGDTAASSKNAAMGVVAGRIAASAVQRKISRVRDGALQPLTFYVGAEPAELADLETINDKGYITFRTFVGKAGYFITDDNLATTPEDDYRAPTNRRGLDNANSPHQAGSAAKAEIDAATIKVHALNEPLPENGLYSNAMAGTDRMELYSTVNAAGDQMMLVSLFDNLGKGSSGAAVQCMNLMLGLEETKGLE